MDFLEFRRRNFDVISLEGTSRSVEFEPGLNIITGPIASGKTTLLRYCRSLLGASFDNFPPEARAAVQAVRGNLVLADLEGLAGFETVEGGGGHCVGLLRSGVQGEMGQRPRCAI